MADAVLALEFGGTRLRAAVVGPGGELLARAEAATQACQGAAHVLARAKALLDSLQSTSGGQCLGGLGISAAGVIDRAGARVLAAQDTLPGWAGTDLRGHFLGSLGPGLPVWADNDANCALAGELWRGAHAATEDALTVMLTLGTGLGGAIAQRSRVLAGHTQRAGHFGSVRVWHARGQAAVPLESVVSGTGLMNLYHQVAGSDGPRATGGLQVAQWAQDAAAPAHAAARAAVQEWVALFAGFLHDLHVSLDPGLVILGGGMLGSRTLWWQPLQRQLNAQHVPLRLAPAALGDEAGLLGAARLAWHGLES